MNFLQRFLNAHVSFADIMFRKLWYIPRMEEMAGKYFGNLTGKMQNNISFKSIKIFS
jgi:hypothetical protein